MTERLVTYADKSSLPTRTFSIFPDGHDNDIILSYSIDDAGETTWTVGIIPNDIVIFVASTRAPGGAASTGG